MPPPTFSFFSNPTAQGGATLPIAPTLNPGGPGLAAPGPGVPGAVAGAGVPGALGPGAVAGGGFLQGLLNLGAGAPGGASPFGGPQIGTAQPGNNLGFPTNVGGTNAVPTTTPGFPAPGGTASTLPPTPVEGVDNSGVPLGASFQEYVANGGQQLGSEQAWRNAKATELQFQSQTGPAFASAFPGVQFRDRPVFQDKPGFDALNPLGGIFGGRGEEDVFGLEGNPTGLAAALNLLLRQVQEGAPRAAESDQLLRGIVENLGGGPAAGLGRDVAGRARDIVSEGSLDELTQTLEQQARAQTASELNRAQQSARDAGLLTGGASAQDVQAQTRNLANQALQERLFAIPQVRAREERERLGAAGGALGTSAAAARALEADPALLLVQRLREAGNPAEAAFISSLLNTGLLQTGQALSNIGPSGFERAAPLIGGFLGATGNILGGLGAGGFFNQQQQQGGGVPGAGSGLRA